MSRVKKSFLNARMNLICYGISLIMAFFTRKVFIDHLGAEFIGLTSTYESILGFMNIAELGVGTAIAYMLYAPLAQKNEAKICEVVSLLGYMYRLIGFAILGVGVILSVFLPMIFSDAPFTMQTLYVGFYAYLISSLLGYFANYRAALLSADQRNYVVTGYYQLTKTAKSLIQMVCAIWITSFILFFAIELIFGVINSLILNCKINKTYPWLRTEIRQGHQLFKKYPEVWRNVKRLFLHRIGGTIQQRVSPLMIFAFVSLPMVTLYTNYTIITSRANNLVKALMSSTEAGIGNMIASCDKSKIYRIFCELYNVRFMILGVISISIYQLASPFITVWLGAEYVLPRIIIMLIALDFFWNILRLIFEQFLQGYGLFADIWVPIARVLTVPVMALCGYLWGMVGILATPLAFQILVIAIWKPYYLYTRGLHEPFAKYLLLLAQNILVFVPSVLCAYWLCHLLGFDSVGQYTWGSWIAYAVVFTGTLSVVSFALYYAFFPSVRYFVSRFVKKRGKKNK